jgi:hypothetical protein
VLLVHRVSKVLLVQQVLIQPLQVQLVPQVQLVLLVLPQV